MKKIKLKVTGMHCKSCEMIITDSLEEAGAKNIKAEFAKNQVEVEFDEKQLNENKIKEIIKKEGYKVE